jgi:uncharacterized protein (TIGR00730 family)
MNLCVYCASSDRIPPIFFDDAQALGRGIAERSWSLVYGGGSVGLMGAVAEAVHSHGGHVIGIIPQGLLDREVGYLRADELIVTTTLRERKQAMDDRADAFIALAGGFGTFEELIEIMTLRQLGYHDKPILIVNTAGYYDPLLAQFEKVFELGFTDPRHRRLYTVVPDIAHAFAVLEG